MSATDNRKAVFSFGLFKADLERGELWRSGVRIKLQEKPFHLLSILLQNADRIVSRQELRQQLWPADTFVEFDDGLNAAVKKLRIALGDLPGNPRFIETVPRRGYRFIAPLQNVDIEPEQREVASSRQFETSSTPEPTTGLAARHLRLVVPTSLTVLVLFLAMTATYLVRARTIAPSRITSIAVLPLANLSSDQDQEFFADGFTDELITDLAKIGSLRVISRSSVMHFKGGQKSIPDIARELNVDAVIEGSISKSGDRIRMRAQLIQARPERHIWAESYERPVADAVALQGELARDIADAIRVQLTPEEEKRLAVKRPVNLESHALYLKGRFFWNKRSLEGYHKAKQYFEQAIAIDPTYAPAYSGLADTYSFLTTEYSVEVCRREALQNIHKALELDPTLAEAHASLGLILPVVNWGWEQAGEHLRRAIELNPNYATAHQWYGDMYLAPKGRLDEAIQQLRIAQQLDPLSPIMATDLGEMLGAAYRLDEAIVELKHALELDPTFPRAHFVLQRVYLAKGMYQEAFAEWKQIQNQSDPYYALGDLTFLQAVSGNHKEARKNLALLLKNSDKPWFEPVLVAQIYMVLGDCEKAFYWLERGYEIKSAWLTLIRSDRLWYPVRDDPRFQDLLRKINLA